MDLIVSATVSRATLSLFILLVFLLGDAGWRVAVRALTHAAKKTFTSAQNRRESERATAQTDGDVGPVAVSVVDKRSVVLNRALPFLHLQEALPVNASCRIFQILTAWQESDRTSSP